MKPFQSQIRLNKFQVDEAQRHLAELMRLEARLREDQAQLEVQAGAEQRIASAAMAEGRIDAGSAYGTYAPILIDRRARIAQSIADVEAQIVAARDALRDAFAELKKFELAAEAAEERARRAQDRRDLIVQDEMGIAIFRRRGS